MGLRTLIYLWILTQNHRLVVIHRRRSQTINSKCLGWFTSPCWNFPDFASGSHCHDSAHFLSWNFSELLLTAWKSLWSRCRKPSWRLWELICRALSLNLCRYLVSRGHWHWGWGLSGSSHTGSVKVAADAHRTVAGFGESSHLRGRVECGEGLMRNDFGLFSHWIHPWSLANIFNTR